MTICKFQERIAFTAPRSALIFIMTVNGRERREKRIKKANDMWKKFRDLKEYRKESMTAEKSESTSQSGINIEIKGWPRGMLGAAAMSGPANGHPSTPARFLIIFFMNVASAAVVEEIFISFLMAYKCNSFHRYTMFHNSEDPQLNEFIN